MRPQALEGNEESSSDDEDVAAHRSQGPTYVQEQQQLRQAFLQVLPATCNGIASLVGVRAFDPADIPSTVPVSLCQPSCTGLKQGCPPALLPES